MKRLPVSQWITDVKSCSLQSPSLVLSDFLPSFFLAAGTNTSDFHLKKQVVTPPVKCEHVLPALNTDLLSYNGHVERQKHRIALS